MVLRVVFWSWILSAYSIVASMAQQELVPGSLLDTVVCLSDSSQTYALFVPPHYDGVKPVPIIYIFDPAARGKTGVRVFHSVAEEYGFILACSNNARNGSWQVVFDAADALIKDTESRLIIDPEQVYTAGFSGGSRAAMALAVILEGRIRGVIGCGAGYPPVRDYQPDSSDGFQYLGLVGNRDMNFYEHQQTEAALNELGIQNTRYIFDGVHEWPPPEIIELAILELLIRSHEHPKNYWLTAYARSVFDHAQNMVSLGFPTYAMARLEAVMSLIGHPSNQCWELAKEISKDKATARNRRRNTKIMAHEQILISRYLNAFRNAQRIDANREFNLEWWSDEIEYLVNMRDRDREQTWNFLGWRMLNLISARSAESAFRSEKSGNVDLAEKLAILWSHADSESPNPLWYRAKLAAGQGKNEKAIDLLMQAHDRGLIEKKSLNHKVFMTLRKNEKFLDLLARLNDE